MRTAVDGSFTLKDLDPSLLFNLLAVAPGHAPLFSTGVDPLKEPVLISLEERPSGEGRDDVLRGQVVDEDGAPILGASVVSKAMVQGDRTQYGRIGGLDPLAVTDEEGRFVLFGAKPGALYHLAATARARATGTLEDVTPGSPTVFQLGAGSTVMGRLVLGGKPLAGAVMGLAQEDRSPKKWVGARSIATDAEGRFTFLNVQPGEAYSVYGIIESLAPFGAVPVRRLESADHGGEVNVGDLLVQPAHTLSGSLELPDGAAVPEGATLQLERNHTWDFQVAELSPTGDFEFRGLPTGAYRLEPSVDGYRPGKANWSFDPLNGTCLEGQIAASLTGLNVAMESGEPDRSSALTAAIIQRFIRRRAQVLGGTEPRAAESATGLFVSCRDGSLTRVELMAGLPNKSVASLDLGEPLRFLAHHPSLPIVYALGNEHLMAVQWSAAESSLALLAKAKVGIAGTHVALDPTARWALVASYGGGAISCLPLSAEGVPRSYTSRVGGGRAKDSRLTKAHQAQWHPSGKLAYVPALGADHVAIFGVEPKTGRLTWTGSAAVDKGTGPRHMALHPTEPWAYVLGEHTSTITSFSLGEQGAEWTPLGQFSNLPDGFAGPGSRSSDIHVSPDGRFLFAVNREPLNDLTSYGIKDDGSLEEVSRASTGGDHARTFALDPVGDRLWVGNTNSKNVFTLSVGLDGSLGVVDGNWEAPGEITCVLAR